MSFLFRTQEPLPPVPTDQVIPVHFFDDHPILRRVVLYNMLVFDDVLDVEKLRSTLENLVKRETWRKLGGRVRKHGKGGLAYHVPAEFTADRPAINFTHVKHDMAKADHPLASRLPSRLPKPSAYPAVVGDPDDFIGLARGTGCPSSYDDYVYSDIPVLGLHLVSFNDATLVTLHWLHIACDALGFKALMESWILMIQGRDDEVLSLHGYNSDPLAELGKHPKEKHKMADKRLTTAGIIQYGLRNGADFTVRAKENRVVYIPARFMEKMRTTALEELAAAQGNTGGEKPFLTEGDILVAWWTRLVISHLPPDSERTVTVQNAYSLRKVLAGDLLPPDRLYVANAMAFLNLIHPARDMLQRPLSWLAARMREAVNEQGSREQVEAYQAMVRKSMYPLPVFLGDGTMHQISYSNWTKANLFQMDFAAAAVAPQGTPCYPSYVQHTQLGMQFPEGFLVMGKDVGGNYWMCGYRAKGKWARVEQELAKLAKE
ncbi:hypothetical protein DL771_008330 [Monosporascus sp. 5C6A]|nr:hypothetical protein DL771_008330 [Monosporascus sp. 5C6A]